MRVVLVDSMTCPMARPTSPKEAPVDRFPPGRAYRNLQVTALRRPINR